MTIALIERGGQGCGMIAFKRFVLSIGAALLGAVSLWACAPTPVTAPPMRMGYSTTACPTTLVMPARTIECGVFTTPQDSAKPDGLRVTFPVVIVRGTKTSAPPVFYLHGGPGGSVVDRLPRTLASAWAQETFTADRTWIFFDQRGAGGGTPRLDCGALSLTDAGIANDADLAALVACVQRFQGQGVDFGRYNAVAITQDIQALRLALGIEQFDLLGVSYGTRVAMAVAQHAPEGLRAMVLDSPYPPEAKGTQDLPQTTADLVRQLASPTPGLADRVAARLATWERAPPPGVTIDDVGQFLVDQLYSREGVATARTWLQQLADGDPAAVIAYLGERSAYDEGQNIAHFCKEELPFESASEMAAAAAGDPIARAVAAPAKRYFAACEKIDVGPPDPAEIQPVRRPTPTLFLVAGVDPGCPLAFAAPAARLMPKAQLAAFSGRTHGILRASACGRRMAAAFLAAPEASLDLTCPTGEPPAPAGLIWPPEGAWNGEKR